jgi:SNF2 family DNA or RNA helicase
MFQVERQWNSPKEVQFEGRFWRLGQKNKVQATYYICRNTIDEWLTQLVENKRIAIDTALKAERFDPEPEALFVDWQELAEMTANKQL